MFDTNDQKSVHYNGATNLLDTGDTMASDKLDLGKEIHAMLLSHPNKPTHVYIQLEEKFYQYAVNMCEVIRKRTAASSTPESRWIRYEGSMCQDTTDSQIEVLGT